MADIFSQTFGDEIPEKGQVIVERPTNVTGSYKERRNKNGGLFSVTYEKYYPFDYTSIFPNSGHVEEVMGTDAINLVGAELGYKRNIDLGSIALLGSYVQGNSASSGDNSTTGNRSLALNRITVSANFALDNLFEEPYVVPYVQGGIYQFRITETMGEQTKSATSGFSYNYRLGVLFQLNWIDRLIDPSPQNEGLRSSGLQNTYIDVFYVTHVAASDAADATAVTSTDAPPNMDSNGEIGVGLKIEF